MEEKRNKRLCYYCDEKLHVGHRCSEGREKEEGEEGSIAVIQTDGPLTEGNGVGELLGISMHAMARYICLKIIRVEGNINHQKVFILIYTDSTHSFMDPYIAKK